MNSVLFKIGAFATTAAVLYAPVYASASNALIADVFDHRQSQSPTVVFPSISSSSTAPVASPAVFESNVSTAPHSEEGVMSQIHRIRALADGWLGPRSIAPSKDAIDKFSAIHREIDLLPNAKSLAPTGVGGLLLEWVDAEKEFTAELEPHGVLFMSIDDGDDSDEIALPFDADTLKRFVVSGRWDA